MSRLFCFYFTHQVQLTCILRSYMYVNYVDCGTAVARINKVNTNAHDASGIFRDVYIQILGKVCRLRDCGSRIWWMIFQWPGILKFSQMSSKNFNSFKDFQSDQIQTSSRKLFTSHYACGNFDLNLTPVTGTTNGLIFQIINSLIESWGVRLPCFDCNQSIKFQCFVTWSRGRAALACMQTFTDGYGPIESGEAEWPRAEGYLG